MPMPKKLKLSQTGLTYAFSNIFVKLVFLFHYEIIEDDEHDVFRHSLK